MRPFIGTDTPTIITYSGIGNDLIGTLCDPSVGLVYLYVAARGVDMSFKIW